MSNAAIHWAWKQKTGSPAAKLVLQVLADLADEAHSCWPSIDHIAEKVEASEKTVRRRLEELEQARMIRKERRYERFGQRSTDRYYLDVEGQISATHALQVNLTADAEPDAKPQVRASEVNLTAHADSAAPLAVNCDRYIETPQEVRSGLGSINNSNQTRPDPGTAREAGPAAEFDRAAVDAELAELLGDEVNLTCDAIERELDGRVQLASVDVVAVVNATVMRSLKRGAAVNQPASYVASVIARHPDRYPAGQTPRPAVPKPPTNVASERPDQLPRVRCGEGIHDWGRTSLPEFERDRCVFCAKRRSLVDPAFAAAESNGWDLPTIAEGAR